MTCSEENQFGLSHGTILLSVHGASHTLRFVRRDAILVAGTALMVIGMTPFVAPVFAVGIGACIFFAIKSIASKKQMAQEDM